jgi:hypothetical protein
MAEVTEAVVMGEVTEAGWAVGSVAGWVVMEAATAVVAVATFATLWTLQETDCVLLLVLTTCKSIFHLMSRVQFHLSFRCLVL